MLKGINIEFASQNSDALGEIRLDEALEGRDLTIQNAIIHTTSSENSNQFFSAYGTGLINGALSGQAINKISATHLSNFAALDTLVFMLNNEDETKEATERVRKLKLLPLEFDNQKFRLGINILFQDGVSYNQIVDF